MRTIAARLILVALVTAIALLEGTPAPSEAAITTAPTLTGPAEGATLTNFGPTLTWTNPSGATQYHLQVIPYNNDGPGVDVHIGLGRH